MIKPGLKGVWSNLHVSCLNRVQSIRAQGKHYTLMWYFLKNYKGNCVAACVDVDGGVKRFNLLSSELIRR